MKIIYNTIKCLFTAVSAAVLLTGCSDCTRPESIDFHYTTLEEKNPALYEAYYKSIREYRDSEHKIVIAKFDNKATAPEGKAEHINALPDSVDFIILQNASVVSETIKAEMQEVRELKGQKSFIRSATNQSRMRGKHTGSSGLQSTLSQKHQKRLQMSRRIL